MGNDVKNKSKKGITERVNKELVPDFRKLTPKIKQLG